MVTFSVGTMCCTTYILDLYVSAANAEYVVVLSHYNTCSTLAKLSEVGSYNIDVGIIGVSSQKMLAQISVEAIV